MSQFKWTEWDSNPQPLPSREMFVGLYRWVRVLFLFNTSWLVRNISNQVRASRKSESHIFRHTALQATEGFEPSRANAH